MSSDCNRVHMYQVWCCKLTPFSFYSADKQTDKQTDATEHPTHAGGYAGVGNLLTAISWQSSSIINVTYATFFIPTVLVNISSYLFTVCSKAGSVYRTAVISCSITSRQSPLPPYPVTFPLPRLLVYLLVSFTVPFSLSYLLHQFSYFPI